jgi:glycosyltransferase involved in cell wall biosynthesis
LTTFAIIIPNYNQSRFLHSALESLRHQSAPFTLAVMDGGSTDNFREVIEGYSDIIAFLRSAPDEGQAAAIKEGKEAISGDIVAWLNADDYYFPGALDKVAACFERYPEVDVVYGDAVHVTEDGSFLSYFPAIQEFNAEDLTRSCFICQPACFVRRSAYQKVGGIDPTLRYTMDWDLWCRLSHSGAKFYYLRNLLTAVRYYPGTKTLSGDTRRYREIWRIERQYGHRRLPWSWAGFYFFDLSFKEHKTVTEKITFSFLKSLRRMKKRLISHWNLENQTDGTLYGFHRWEPVVVGKGTIHLPWYDKRRLTKILLRVTPAGRSYRTTINGAYETVVLAREGQFSIDVPLLDKPSVEISIECLDQQRWTLLDFSCG